MAMNVASDRALAFAADHFERRVLGPVDEVVHVFQAELDGHRQVLDSCFELGRSYPSCKRVELLALLALALVEADPALNSLRHALGGKTRLQPLAVAHVAALVGAAGPRRSTGRAPSEERDSDGRWCGRSLRCTRA